MISESRYHEITRSREHKIVICANDYFLSKMSLSEPMELRAVVAS